MATDPHNAMTMATPMMHQYESIKSRYPGEILMFRMGDFYEMFGDDAVKASKILDIALTSRHKGGPNEMKMCGVPYHALDNYLPKLTRAGVRVAICDQVSDPKLPGIVQRAVTQVVTSGTTMSESILRPKENNYLVALVKKKFYGLAFVDLSTGEFRVTEIHDDQELVSELKRLSPPEVLLDTSQKDDMVLPRLLRGYTVNFFDGESGEKPDEFLKNYFHIRGLESFGLEKMTLGISSAVLVLRYLHEMQKRELTHIQKIIPYDIHHFMALDEVTIRNLEIFSNNFDGTSKHSLVDVIDYTKTPMGGRKLRSSLLRPLQKPHEIEERLSGVEEFFRSRALREDAQSVLSEMSDIERLLARIGCGRANPKDMVALSESLARLPHIKTLLATCSYRKLKELGNAINEHRDVVDLVRKIIKENPPVNMLDGGFIADGFHAELDELRGISTQGKDFLLELQERERISTGITTLKVKFNRIFGYYIEVSNGQVGNVPDRYIRKQTLVNAERFITPELKEYEEKVLGAEEKIKEIELRIFQELIVKLLPHIAAMQKTALQIAIFDVLVSFAQLAYEKKYTRPEIVSTGEIHIKQGRHPVIDAISNTHYVPNDLELSNDTRVVILTGPNMSGKSSYIRQNALIVLLAHIGCFVPASSARIGIVDRIFTRVGASDNLSAGQSTFMVEMQEAANIIHNATEKSLIIFDELGRGTSTYDGVSIAWAVVKYVHDILRSKTLFATHYHELVKLGDQLAHATNKSVKVKESKDGEVIFLHEVVSGGANRSYGIEVAKLAGLPNEIIARAKKILEQLAGENIGEVKDLMVQDGLFSTVSKTPARHPLLAELETLNPDAMTPIEALQKIREWKENLEKCG